MYHKFCQEPTLQRLDTFEEQCIVSSSSNSIAGACHIINGIHLSCASKVEPLLLKEPPPTPPQPLGLSIWEPFNRINYSISLAKDDDNFFHQDVCFAATMTIPTGVPTGVLIKYFLHHTGSDENCLTGLLVVSSKGLCPPRPLMPAQIPTSSSTYLASSLPMRTTFILGHLAIQVCLLFWVH
jgi:hypothetical protein